jgi:two-component system response regulator
MTPHLTAVEEDAVILLVEDSEDDLLLFKRALLATGLPFQVRNVETCSEARSYLLGAGQFADRAAFPFPQLIIADNCRGPFDTAEFLLWLRGHPQCRVIPVVMLSGSRDPRLIETAYELGLHSFFEKPNNHIALQSLLKMVLDYWAATLVPDSRPCGSA